MSVYLLAAPGSLMVTPDPKGAVARRAVLPSLTPLWVRPPSWTDPGGSTYPAKTLVLECEDRGVPVLIVTAEKDMPWVLGALAAPATRD